MSLDGYLPIADHGLIGDLHTVALVGMDGTIDWYCCPRFDSPSVFGAILDKDRAGTSASRSGDDDWTQKQLYFPDTNVLITRFLTPDGVGEVTDFMPVDRPGELSGPPPIDPPGARACAARWLRRRGRAALRLRASAPCDARGKNGVVFELARAHARTSTTTSLERTPRPACGPSLTLSAGESGDLRRRAGAGAEPRPCARRPRPRTLSATVDVLARAGSPSPTTAAAGARWCTARRSR